MKKLLVLATIALMLLVAACQKAEAPVPTERDGEQVWHNVLEHDHGIELLSFRKINGQLVLLCYKNWRRQQGHLGRERARWAAIWRRRLAMECGVCRSVLIGSATRFRTVWQAG